MMLSPKYSDRLTIIESLVRLVSLQGYTEIPARIFFSKMIEFSKRFHELLCWIIVRHSTQ